MNHDSNQPQPQPTQDGLPPDLVKTPMLIIGNHALHAYKTIPSQWTSRVYIPVNEFSSEGDDHA